MLKTSLALAFAAMIGFGLTGTVAPAEAKVKSHINIFIGFGDGWHSHRVCKWVWHHHHKHKKCWWVKERHHHHHHHH